MGSRNHGRIGLACAGGVVEGAFYEIGALCALEEAIEGVQFHELDVYVGVSSGALVTSFLANGVSVRTMSLAVLSQADPLLNIRPDVLFRPAFKEYLHRFGRLPGALLKTLQRYLTNPADLSLFGSLSGLSEVLPVGLFDNEPLHKYLDRAFAVEGRTNDFRKLRSKLRVVAIDVDSAEITCFGNEGKDHIPISRAVQASTALPGLYCPVEIDGRYYIDGVAKKTVHASKALKEGAELLFCINPIVPANTRLKQEGQGALRPTQTNMVDRGLPTVLSQTFRTLVHSRMRTGFKNYEYVYPDADIIVIEPRSDDYIMFFSNIFSFSNRKGVCEHAYRTTRAFLREHAEEISPRLDRHGLRLLPDVLNDTERTLYGEEGPLQRRLPPSSTQEADLALDRIDEVLERLLHAKNGAV